MVAVVEHQPTSLAECYLGQELPKGIARIYHLFSSNLAPSYIPSCLYDSTHLNWPVEKLVRQPRVTQVVLDNLTGDIKNHIELKIQLLLQQLCLVYKTQLCFEEIDHAEDQIGQAKGGEGKYAGAHNGILPVLRIYKSEFSDTSVSFAKGSSFYYAWNSTTYLPKIVNVTDSLLDSSARGVSASLRKQTIAILNAASQGEFNPQEGLSEFLRIFLVVMQVRIDLERDPMKLYVLKTYLSVIEIYQDHLEEGYPLIQKMFFQPLTSVVDEQFFMNMQAQMHKKFIQEMEQLKPPEVASATPFPPESDVKGVLEQVVSKLERREFSKTLREHVRLALLSKEVQQVAVRFLTYFDQLALMERERSLKRLLSIKTTKALKKKDLTETEKALHAAVLRAIRGDRKEYEPRGVSLTLIKILSCVGSQLVSDRVQPQRTTCRDLKHTVHAILVEKGVERTETTQKYLSLCKESERVMQVASNFFRYLQTLPDQQQESELKSLFCIKTEKSVGNAGLSSQALALYGVALTTLRENTKIKNPRNIGLVLADLLIIGKITFP